MAMNLETLETISSHAFDDETQSVEALIAQLKHLPAMESRIMAQAQNWVKELRKNGPGHGMEAFLQTYGLDTREGIALMCLAEALLRIPDAATADQLIHNTFEGKDWREHIEGDESWLIGASSWGLWLTGKVVAPAETAKGLAGALNNVMGKLGEPVVRQALKQAMRLIGSQFVLGESIEEGLKEAQSWEKRGYRMSYDILGEGARSDAQALAYVAAYRDAIERIGKHAASNLFEAPGISVKLSALHPRYSLSQQDRVLNELLPRLKEILRLAKQHNIAVSIDAEEANRLDIELILFSALLEDPEFDGWNGIGFVLQAYQKRAIHVLDLLQQWAQQHKRILPVRLVKGAYWDSEIKHAQIHGLPNYPVFTHKAHTDISYLACADKLLQHTACFYPQFATHNARTMASIEVLASHYRLTPNQFEFQRLHGMGEQLHAQIEGKFATRIYAPIGEHKDLLAYLIRRLLENGANTSFVNLLMDEEIPMEELLADPLRKASKTQIIPLPKDIYSDRKNSRGVDVGYVPMRKAIQQALAQIGNVPQQKSDDAAAVAQTISQAAEAFTDWSATPIHERAARLEAVADVLEENSSSLISLLAEEAKKTAMDAVAEVREAADFCRYYAQQARKLFAIQTLEGPTGELNQLQIHARGVFACISPWNFPLAIFTGQIAAALVTGNSVIAKPAEQTPRIAALAVELMHKAGIPNHALKLVVGDGSIGKLMTQDPRLAGVVFTGSVEVAQNINQTLAARKGSIIPLIAETGGQNCMVIDSSALLEQAVDDIVLSAFGSAGQRCSALRVLYVQEEIAQPLMTLLRGAMAELKLGNPTDLSTDMGPVIDAEAQKNLLDHIATMSKSAKLIAAAPASKQTGNFVTPHAFELRNIEQLTKENFGPVLHIIRFNAKDHVAVVRAINSTGYGLTFGIHSRIQQNIDYFLHHVHAGNYYVNRSMIGAVVGVQPFGGEGLSGTGPKAGGPYYLQRFVHERTRSINSAAIGGNVALMTGNLAQ